jgi:hypothetical protein
MRKDIVPVGMNPELTAPKDIDSPPFVKVKKIIKARFSANSRESVRD